MILSGHTDVVPVAGQEWHSDPFRLTETDGNLYGRGTADMKGFIALALALVPEAARRELAVPLHLAFSHDEEVGCLGAPALIRSLPEGIARPAMAIIGEPTSMQVANRQKGLSFFRTRITGREGHSSAPDLGVSAIAAAAEIILEIGRLHAEGRAVAPPDSGFDPPHTTMSVGTISGGTAVNIIARECTFEWDMRNLPQDDAAALKSRIDRFVDEALLPRMRAVYPQAADRDRNRRRGAAVDPWAGFAGRGTGAASDRREYNDRRLVRDRGRAVSAGGHPGDRLRSRLDRGRAQARRIHHPRRAGGRTSLPRPAPRLGDNP